MAAEEAPEVEGAGLPAMAMSGGNRDPATMEGDGREEQEVLTAHVDTSPLARFILDKQLLEGMSRFGLAWWLQVC